VILSVLFDESDPVLKRRDTVRTATTARPTSRSAICSSGEPCSGCIRVVVEYRLLVAAQLTLESAPWASGAVEASGGSLACPASTDRKDAISRIVIAFVAGIVVLLLAGCGGRNGADKEARELASTLLDSGRAHYAGQLVLARGDEDRALRATDDYLSLAGLAAQGLGDEEVADELTKDILVARSVCRPCARRLEQTVRELRKPGRFGSITGP
jgi:hypothetical protein